MPSLTNNPFLRGYHAFCCERVVQIIYDDYCEPCYRPLHPSQAHLPDHELSRCSCAFDDDLALITQGQTVAEHLLTTSTDQGVVAAVIYPLTADHAGQRVHLGDYPSEDAAQAVIGQLTFTTGHYSRSWEISSAHLPPAEFRLLEERTWRGIASGFFESFELFENHAIGCKLYSTPWLEDASQPAGAASHAEVLARLQEEQVPPVLLAVLLMAGQADVRFLVFDPDAAPIGELPLYLDD